MVLMFGAILTTGRRNVSNLLRTVPLLTKGDASSYHRVLSHRRWSMWPLARALAQFIISHWVPEGPVRLAGDDTVDGHPGRKVYGKGRHRDPVRSTHTFSAYRYGHKWLVLSILVKFPFTHRPWALPILVALYRTRDWNKKHKRRHKTPARIMRQLLCVVMRWFPEKQFRFTGDGGFSAHASAAQAHRFSERLTLIGKFHPEAALYDLPKQPAINKRGRPRKRGKKKRTPRMVVARAQRKKRLTVSWYGGRMRTVRVVTGTGNWYQRSGGLVPVRWVFVEDLDGTHRDEYFFSTDVQMSAKEIIEAYTGRWSIEVTFQEARAYLGLESTRGWTQNTVLRMAPCLFGLYSLVALWYAQLSQRDQQAGRLHWSGKDTVTFSDAITAVRRWIWRKGIFAECDQTGTLQKIPRRLMHILLYALAPAA